MNDVLAGRKLFTFKDAIVFNEQIINRWKPVTEVWPFRFGDAFLGTMNTLGSIFITHYFRKEFKLRPFARLTCYMPAVGLPAMGCFFFNSVVITTNVITKDSCPLCITAKSTILQPVFGIVCPLLIAPTVCLYVADKLLTYPVPPLVKAPKEVFLLIKKLILKNPRPFLVLGAMHMIAASVITFQKQKCLRYIEENRL